MLTNDVRTFGCRPGCSGTARRGGGAKVTQTAVSLFPPRWCEPEAPPPLTPARRSMRRARALPARWRGGGARADAPAGEGAKLCHSGLAPWSPSLAAQAGVRAELMVAHLRVKPQGQQRRRVKGVWAGANAHSLRPQNLKVTLRFRVFHLTCEGVDNEFCFAKPTIAGGCPLKGWAGGYRCVFAP